MIAAGHVLPSDHSLSSSMILVASSRLRSIYIIYRPAFPHGKDPGKGVDEMSGACYSALSNANGWLRGDGVIRLRTGTFEINY